MADFRVLYGSPEDVEIRLDPSGQRPSVWPLIWRDDFNIPGGIVCPAEKQRDVTEYTQDALDDYDYEAWGNGVLFVGKPEEFRDYRVRLRIKENRLSLYVEIENERFICLNDYLESLNDKKGDEDG